MGMGFIDQTSNRPAVKVLQFSRGCCLGTEIGQGGDQVARDEQTTPRKGVLKVLRHAGGGHDQLDGGGAGGPEGGGELIENAVGFSASSRPDE